MISTAEKITLSVDLRGVLLTDLEHLTGYIWWNQESLAYFVREKQYQLMAYLSNQLPKGSKIADLGTYTGASAVAFAINKDVRVLSYDVVDIVKDIPSSYKTLPNVKFILGDCLDHIDEFIDAQIIHLDIDPHDGIQEEKIFNFLLEKGFKGLLICDDIHLKDSMKRFWSSINLKKYDITGCGHWSGTGAVVFDSEYLDLKVN